MSSLAKLNGIIKTKQLCNFLVFSGFLFSLSRLVRGTDNFYIFAIISFSLLWFINIRAIFSKEIWSVLFWFLPFGVWALLSSIWSLEPFISFSRGLFYIFISSTAVLIGFLYKSKLSELFKIVLVINTLVILISVLSLVSGIPSDAWTANHGMGFTSVFIHQNTLAAVLLFTLIGPVYFLLNACPPSSWRVIPNLFRDSPKQMLKQVQHDNKSSSHSEFISESKDDAKKKGNVISNLFRVRNLIVSRSLILLSILIILNFYFIYISYSRAVMLALFIGGMVMFILLTSLKTNIIFALIFVIVGTSLFYFMGNELQSYFKKGGSDYSGRRQILWEPSFKAAVNGGFIGLGYGVTDPTIESNYKKENRLGELKREKGNSILALIEETGIVGLILFLLPLFTSFRNYLFKKSSVFNISTTPKAGKLYLLFSFLLMLFVHSQFEAWMVGVSSFYLVVFLTMISGIIVNSNERTVNSNQKPVQSAGVLSEE